jgi:hypothetical protein
LTGCSGLHYQLLEHLPAGVIKGSTDVLSGVQWLVASLIVGETKEVCDNRIVAPARLSNSRKTLKPLLSSTVVSM